MVKIDNILFLTDLSDDSAYVFEYARYMAEHFGSKLYVMHVIADPTSILYGKVEGDYLKMEKQARSRARETMAKYEDLLKDYPKHEIVIKEGPVLANVLDSIQEKRIDSLVMGSTGGGVLRNLLTGSIGERLVRGAQCPVWIIRHPAPASK